MGGNADDDFSEESGGTNKWNARILRYRNYVYYRSERFQNSKSKVKPESYKIFEDNFINTNET